MTTLTAAQVAALVKQEGFPQPDWVTMVAIARAESGFNVGAVGGPNSNGTYDYGLFQINSVHGYDRGKLTSDAAYNTHAAHDIYSSQGLRAWSTYNNGAYKQFVNEARQGVAQAANVNGTGAVPTAGSSGGANSQPAITYGPPGPQFTAAGQGAPMAADEDVFGPLAGFFIRGTQVAGNFSDSIIGAPTFESGVDIVPNLKFTVVDENGGLLDSLNAQGYFWSRGGAVNYRDLTMRMDEIKFEPGSHSTGQITVTAADDIVFALMELKGPRTASGISATEWISQELRLCGLDPNRVFLGESVPTQSVIARDEADQASSSGNGQQPSAWTTIVRLAKELGKRVFISGTRLVFGSANFAAAWAAPGAVRLSYSGYGEGERFITLPTVTRVTIGSRQVMQIEGRIPLNRAKFFRPGAAVLISQIPGAIGGTETMMMVSRLAHDLSTDTDGADITLLEPVDPPPQPPTSTAGGVNGGPTSAGGASGGGADGQVDRFVATALAQAGKAYVYGATAAASDPNPRAFDCCLTADTMIYTANRGPVRMDEIEAGDMAWSMTDGLVARKIEAVAQQRVQPIFKVRTRGRALRASANHPVAVLRRGERSRKDGRWLPVPWWIEWARVDELARGDLIVALDHAPSCDEEVRLPDGTLIDPDIAWLLGEFLGDGHCTSSGIAIAAFRPLIRQRIARIVAGKWGARTTEHPTHGVIVNSVALRRMFHQIGMDRRAQDKRVPHPLRRLAPAVLRAFLAGYAEADGHFDKRGHQSYSSCSRALVADVRALHIALGDRTSNITTMERTKQIVIKGRPVREALPLHSFAVYPDTEGVTARRHQTTLDTYGARRALPDRAFIVERVLAVEPDGEEATYDLQIEGSRNYVAEGLVVHNSELVQWSCERVGINGCPRTSEQQQSWCSSAGTLISVQQGINTKGALLFQPGHVAISLGNGKTIEAMNEQYGVRQGNANGRGWTAAGKIPGAQGYR